MADLRTDSGRRARPRADHIGNREGSELAFELNGEQCDGLMRNVERYLHSETPITTSAAARLCTSIT
jgi:hypothetical protein